MCVNIVDLLVKKRKEKKFYNGWKSELKS